MTSTTLAPPDTGHEAGPSRAALPVLLAGTFISPLDFFIVNVALPDTQRTLHAGPSAIQFIVAGYGLALAAGLITAGRLGDLYGRGRPSLIGLPPFHRGAPGLWPRARRGFPGRRPGGPGSRRRLGAAPDPRHHQRELHRGQEGE